MKNLSAYPRFAVGEKFIITHYKAFKENNQTKIHYFFVLGAFLRPWNSPAAVSQPLIPPA
jgi:hypothetical protein